VNTLASKRERAHLTPQSAEGVSHVLHLEDHSFKASLVHCLFEECRKEGRMFMTSRGDAVWFDNLGRVDLVSDL
jgi:hypothetical protein